MKKSEMKEQTVLDQGIAQENQPVGTTSNKKKRGFKRGAVAGTLGGIFLGGAGAAYAIENDITMDDVEKGISDFMDDVNRGINSLTNGDTAKEDSSVVAEEKVAEVTPANEVVAETPTEETAETPAEETAETPAEETAETPAEETAETPAEETVETPAEEIVETPAEEIVETPAEEIVETPAEEIVETPAEEIVETPAEEIVETPAEEIVETPAEEIVETPAEETVETLTEETVETQVEEEVKPLSGEQVIDAIHDAVDANGEDVAEEAADTLTGEQVIDAIHDAVDAGTDVTVDDDALEVSPADYDELSFDDAYAAARAEVGPGGVFEWRGGLYGVFTADEWTAMSDEDKAGYGSKVTELLQDYQFNDDTDDVVVDDPGNVEVVNDPDDVVVDDPGNVEVVDDPVEIISEPADDIEVILDNTYNITDAHGEEINVVDMTVGGEDVVLIDEDGDGVMDVMIYDENGDGVIDDADTFNISDEGLTMDDFNGMVADDADGMM